MKSLAILLATTLIIGSNAGMSVALPAARNVYSQDAQGSNTRGIDLKVWSGYGLTINFIPTGEIIKQVWLGDPSRFALTSNGSLCQRGGSDENCGTGGATVLFLRQIKPINFPSLTSSQDGSTVITVITASAEGQKHYQFKLTPAKGKPEYTALIIRPDSDIPRTILVEKPPVTQINSRPTQNNQVVVSSENRSIKAGEQSSRGGQQATNNNSVNVPESEVSTVAIINQNENLSQKNTNIPVETNSGKKINSSVVNSVQVGTSTKRNDANAVAYGLGVAVNKGVVKLRSKEWSKAQDTIRLLRRGKTRVEAVKLSGIPQELFDKLIQWGQN